MCSSSESSSDDTDDTIWSGFYVNGPNISRDTTIIYAFDDNENDNNDDNNDDNIKDNNDDDIKNDNIKNDNNKDNNTVHNISMMKRPVFFGSIFAADDLNDDGIPDDESSISSSEVFDIIEPPQRRPGRRSHRRGGRKQRLRQKRRVAYSPLQPNVLEESQHK